MHRLIVQEPWFSEIASGRKIVEGRAASRGEYDSWIGPIIISNGCGVEVQAKLLQTTHYENLGAYLDAEWKSAAPHAISRVHAEELYRNIYYEKCGENIQVFSEARIREKGGIEALLVLVN